MIKNILVAGACMLALVAQPALAEEDATEAPTMSFGTWGFDTSMLSPEINPGDDFFAYANQKWLDENPLPAEYSRYGAFNLLRDKSTHDVQTLIDDLVANSDGLPLSEKRIVDAYNAYLDTEAIDAGDLAPARPYLDAIRGATSLTELVALWGSAEFSAPMFGFVTVDAKEPTRYSVYVGSGGLGMPDRTYYLDDSEKGLGIQEKYRAYLEFLLDEAGMDDATGMAQQVYGFEDAVARTVSWDRTVRRNRDLTYNAMTPEQMHEMGGDFPTGEFLAAAGFDATDRFVVRDIPPTEERVKELGLS